MKIAGLQKLTLLDYPSKTACIIFTQGCTFKCSFCQNSELIPLSGNEEITEDDIINYLIKRKNVLDGVVITGGEPTIQKDLKDFIKKIKELGYLVKLDTNGANYSMLKELIEENLIDYVAMDIKTTFEDYEKVIKTKTKMDNIKESIKLLKNSSISHEFRTTIIKNIHDIGKILEICKYLGDSEKYYLQNFEQSEYVVDKTLESFSKEELINIQKIVGEKFPNVIVRNL